MNSYFNYHKATKWLESKGQELFGNHFKIYDEDKTIIHKLMAYNTGDEKEARQLNINLEKGILLSGPIGCGKTTLMTLMKHLTTPQKKYYVKSCREVSFEFIKEGYDVIAGIANQVCINPKQASSALTILVLKTI